MEFPNGTVEFSELSGRYLAFPLRSGDKISINGQEYVAYDVVVSQRPNAAPSKGPLEFLQIYLRHL
jgi:hypothetical protein